LQHKKKTDKKQGDPNQQEVHFICRGDEWRINFIHTKLSATANGKSI